MLRAAQRADPAIDMAGLLTMSVALPSQAYPTPTERARFYEQLEARIASLAPTSSIASAVPFGGAFARHLTIEGREAAAGTPPPTVSALAVSPRYFQTLGVPVVRGRAFDNRDGTPGREHAIVNQRFADLYFSDADPIGRRIRLAAGSSPSESTWLTIVGLSRTIRQRQARPEPIVYTPYRADPPANAALLIRGGSDISALSARVREEVRGLDPDLPLHAVATLEKAVAQFYWLGRMSNLLATVLVTIAVGLCAVGLYAVTAHAAVQRRQEIGVRTTLGARPRHILSLVVGRAARPLGLGLAFGLAGTLAWTRLFVPSANGYSFDDALNAFAAAAVLILVSLAACLAPARRATRVDPALALRCE
jgi:putative ABC transport system permease protein